MIDIYSTPIGFTYKNKFKIKTCFGGVLTIVTTILTVVYFCILIAKPIKLISLDSSFVSGLFGSGGTQGGTWNKTVKSYFVNKSNKRMTHLNQVDVQPYWNVAFVMSGGYDPTFVKLNFTNVQWYKGNMTPKDVPMQLCSSDSRYPYYQYAKTMYCPTTFYMFKDFSTSEHFKLRVYIQRCTGNGCKSDSEIDDYINKVYISMGTYNSFYDSSNLESPIQKYYDEKYVYKLSNKPWVSMDIIQTDVVYTTGEVQSIYETGDIISTEYFNSSSDPTIAIFEFFLSPKYYEIHQKVEYEYTNSSSTSGSNSTRLLSTDSITSASASSQGVSDRNEFYFLFVLAQVGGLYSLLRLVCGTIVSVFSENWLLIQILNSLRSKIRFSKYRKNFFNGLSTKTKPISPKQNKRRNIENNEENTVKSLEKKDKNINLISKINRGKHLKNIIYITLLLIKLFIKYVDLSIVLVENIIHTKKDFHSSYKFSNLKVILILFKLCIQLS